MALRAARTHAEIKRVAPPQEDHMATISRPTHVGTTLDLPRVPAPRLSDGLTVSLLRAGIPLSLLMDLAGPDPHSEELYRLELSR